MITSKIFTDWERVVSPYTTTDGVPTLFHQGLGTRKLEIVDVDDQEHFPLLMPEAAAPLINGRKTQRFQMAFTMSFPVAPCIRMSIKGKDKRTDRVSHVLPRLRPLLSR
jgi:hypothetical protein